MLSVDSNSTCPSLEQENKRWKLESSKRKQGEDSSSAQLGLTWTKVLRSCLGWMSVVGSTGKEDEIGPILTL